MMPWPGNCRSDRLALDATRAQAKNATGAKLESTRMESESHREYRNRRYSSPPSSGYACLPE